VLTRDYFPPVSQLDWTKLNQEWIDHFQRIASEHNPSPWTVAVEAALEWKRLRGAERHSPDDAGKLIDLIERESHGTLWAMFAEAVAAWLCSHGVSRATSLSYQLDQLNALVSLLQNDA
jgi:hypothetical protein